MLLHDRPYPVCPVADFGPRRRRGCRHVLAVDLAAASGGFATCMVVGRLSPAAGLAETLQSEPSARPDGAMGSVPISEQTISRHHIGTPAIISK